MAATAEDLIRHHRFTVDEYHRMGETGIFHQDDRVELIEGEIVEMSPIGSPHAGATRRIQKRIERAVGDAALVSIQSPVLLGARSEPEPDIALLRPRDDFYSGSHPGPKDVLLLIEVSESSLRYDREIKVPIYARHGIPAVWLVDLAGRRLLVFSQPSQTGYQKEITADVRKPLPIPGLDGLEVDLQRLF